jgi:PPK2 family polyphosphate:nucleotide phosphotransferase
MRPAPVPPGTRVSLRSRDAAPPPGLPSDLPRATEAVLERLGDLQAALYAEATRALLIVMQGRDASGKDATITAVCRGINPQGCRVTSFKAPTETELSHDFLWRVHREVPARRMVGVFNRSQYEDVVTVRVHRLVPRKVWAKRYRQINEFEHTLTESGTTIVKFCLHVSKAEQRRRLMSRLTDPKKNWKFSESDLADRALWDQFTTAYQDMLAKCSTPWAPWYVIPADDKDARNYLVARVVVTVLERMAPRFPRVKRALLRRAQRMI